MVWKSWYITWKGIQKKGGRKTEKKKSLKNIIVKGKVLDDWSYYSGLAEDAFCILHA